MPKKKQEKEYGVIYARYSSDRQREESIEGQLRECHQYAERNGITVIGEYTDHAISGKTDKRPDFQRMIKDSEKGNFSVVITWKNDRFARNRYDSAIYKHQLKQNGVRVVYARENIPEGAEGIILDAVMEGLAEYYSANLAENIKRGQYDSAIKLKTMGYRVFGLRKGTDGRWEHDPATAPVVKRIFEEYAAGRPAVDIYADLNREGQRTVLGKPFNKNSIRWILKNEKYCGVYQYADVRVEDGIPPIVTRELWEDVQKMVKKHHIKPALKRDDGGFILTGKIFCGHCENPMVGDSGTGKAGKVYRYYTCTGRKTGGCKKERAPKGWIEDLVVQKLAEIANNDEIIDTFADRFMEWQKKQKNNRPESGLKERLKDVEKSIANIIKTIEGGVSSEALSQRLRELETERVDLNRGIAIESLSEPELSREDVIDFLHTFRDGDPNDEAWRIFIVDTFLNKAFLYDDGRLILVLNFSGENNTVTVQMAENALEHGELLCSDSAQTEPSNRAKKNTQKTACLSDFERNPVRICEPAAQKKNTATVFFDGLLVAVVLGAKRTGKP